MREGQSVMTTNTENQGASKGMRGMQLLTVLSVTFAVLLTAACSSGGTATPTDAAKVAVPVAVSVDSVTSSPGAGLVDATAACVQQSVFKRGMHIVFRMSAQDTVTGKALGEAEISDAILQLPSGDELAFKYAKHGKEADSPFFWSTAWDVPMDFPLGAVDYKVVVTTVAGDTATWTQPRPVPASVLQITE